MFIEQLGDTDKLLIDHLRRMGVEDEYDSDFCSGSFTSCENFLRFWEQNKSVYMSEVFKDQLILKKKINVMIEDETLYDEMEYLLNSEDFSEIENKITLMLSEYNNLSAYISNSLLTIHDNLIVNAFQNVQSMIDNKYSGPTLELALPSGKIFKLVTGCKLMKALGRLAKEAGVEREFEQIRIKQSQVMNEAKICSNLCLSIHPMDYITASYNDCGWHSCMNWEDGDYRRGVIEMMNSPYVIVAYLESKHDSLGFYLGQDNPNVPWNSKKWREFIIVSEDGIFGIKGYPFWNRPVEDIVLKWVKELFSSDKLSYSDKIIEWEPDNDDLLTDMSVNSQYKIQMSCGPAMYNDFYNGNVYHAIMAADVRKLNCRINYSGESECVVCGDTRGFDDCSDLGCYDCFEYHSCYYCGEEILNSNDLHELNGREYCDYCWYNQLPSCDSCGDKLELQEGSDVEPEDGIRFYLGSPDSSQVYTNELGYDQTFCICPYCADRVFTLGLEELNEDHAPYRGWIHTNIVPITRIKDFQALNADFVNLKEFIKKYLGSED